MEAGRLIGELGLLAGVLVIFWRYIRQHIDVLRGRLDDALDELKLCRESRYEMLNQYHNQISDLKAEIAKLKAVNDKPVNTTYKVGDKSYTPKAKRSSINNKA